MFSRQKPQIDIKKSTLKLLDTKKDVPTRIKHLKLILDTVDIFEAKILFSSHYSAIYQLVYEGIFAAEVNLKLRGAHRVQREELECALLLLEKIFILLPDLLHCRWQLHSISTLMTKLNHPENSIRVRREGLRLFILWYQCLGSSASTYVNQLFACLVPGLGKAGETSPWTIPSHDKNREVEPGDICPLLPAPPDERQPEDINSFLFECLLEFIVTQTSKILWNEGSQNWAKSFHFLYERLKSHYIPRIFPNFSIKTDIYNPILELPEPRFGSELSNTPSTNCAVIFIKWIANYAHSVHNNSSDYMHPFRIDGSSKSDAGNPYDDVDVNVIAKNVILGNRENINLVHEVFRRALLLPFSQSAAVRRVVCVYKDWIQINVPELPIFMLEPDSENHEGEGGEGGARKGAIYDNNSSVGLMNNNREYFTHLRAGAQSILRVFFNNSASVFLLFHTPTSESENIFIEEQVDVCKRVLNIYRYAVMNTRMDSKTWEQLLIVMLHTTSRVLDQSLPRNFLKHPETLGYKLASALFQTLIVSWVKASLNVPIKVELWDQLQSVLSELNISDDLIVEWAKTMETLTRVLSKHVYNLDLANLPSDRLTEQKTKRLRGGRKSEAFVKDSFSSESQPQSLKEVEKPTFQKCKIDQKSLILPPSAALPIKRSLTRSISEGNIFRVTKSVKLDLKVHEIQTKRKRSKSLCSIETVSHFENIAASHQHQDNWGEISSSTTSLDNSSAIHNLNGSDGMEYNSKETGVIAGGRIKGWLPSVAALLWKRMLGILGDVNTFQNPETFSHFFQVLTNIWSTLYKIRENQSISLDNMTSPGPPKIVPPLALILPWCLKCFDLDGDFNRGKVLALSLTTNITLINQDLPLSQEYLCKLFSIMHRIINGKNQELVNELVRNIGQRFLSKMLPGGSIMFLNFIQATHSVLSRGDLKKTPRHEAASLLGSILLISELCKDLPQLKPNTLQFLPVSSLQTKDLALSCLIKYSKVEPSAQSRAIALQSLSIYLCKLLLRIRHSSNPQKLVQENPIVVQIITLFSESIKVQNRNVALVSSDILQVLAEFAPEISTHFPLKLLSQIFLSLKISLEQSIPKKGKSWSSGMPFEMEKRFIISNLYTIGEWCLHLPLETLLALFSTPDANTEANGTILDSIFDVLNKLMNGYQRSPTDNPKLFMEDFDSNIPFDDLQSSIDTSQEPGFMDDFQNFDSIKLAASNLVYILMTQISHFPINNEASRCSSIISEHDDLPPGIPGTFELEELNSNIFLLPNLQMFALEPQNLMSMIRLPPEEIGNKTLSNQTRIILRNPSGKYAWDIAPIVPLEDSDELDSCPSKEQLHFYETPDEVYPSAFTGNFPPTNKQRINIRKRPVGILPTFENSNQDLDNLDDLLGYISHTSPECLLKMDEPLTTPSSQIGSLSQEHEDDIIGTVVNQRNAELEYLRRFDQDISLRSSPISRCIDSPGDRGKDIEVCSNKDYISSLEMSNFFHCRRLFSLLGFNAWEERKNILLLNKDERLLRELKNLDSQKCREVHKIAVIYVAHGQEDKQSILYNSGGSEAYEEFVSGLGWEVELDSHSGFLGGLYRNKSSGETAPYFASAFTEVIFHVSTRMPSQSEECLLHKTKHLGNDEVHIIWSEHSRDYRRDIIPTEFCDVLIVIYPIQFDLYRIQISRKKEVPYFGPLYNECIVSRDVLPTLVRATAINASRAKRSSIKFYRHYFEERTKSLTNLIKSHKIRSTFEDFSSNVFAPNLQSSPSSKADSVFIDSSLNLNSWSKQSRESPFASSFAPTYESSSVPQSPAPPIPPKRMSLKGLKQRPQNSSSFSTKQ